MTKEWWSLENYARRIPYLKERAQIVAEVREFFNARGYLEVETPALQIAPCMEPHIKAFRTESVYSPGLYLHTSPEFAMKKLLVAGLPKIYQIAQVFRDEEKSKLHSPAFSLLEWYQAGMDYKEMMQETIDLVRAVVREKIVFHGKTSDPCAEWEIITVAGALKKYAGVDISAHLGDLAHIRAEAARIGVYVSPHDDWENALLKILMDRVEPHLGAPAPAILCDYPVSMAALSRPKPEDPRFAERFEVYICSVELANAFGELTDATVQQMRFLHDIALRRKIYGVDYPLDEDFIAALKHGMPAASGNALGIDRLVMLLTGAEDIALVRAAPVEENRHTGWTALHHAAAAEAEGIDVAKIVAELLDAGADPHAPDRKGDTAFNIAAPSSPVAGRLMTLHWLSGKTAKGLNETSGSHGSTLAQYIAKWSRDDEIEAHLKTEGLKIDIQNASGWTPLHAAAAMGRAKAVEVLARFYDAKSRAALTREEYRANYNGHTVVYAAGLDAAGIARARLAQDKGLSPALREALQACGELLV